MIAVIADIHGNLHALDAVLDDMPVVSQVWILGDLIGEMPYPCEVLDRLMNLDIEIYSIAGNREISLSELHRGEHQDWRGGRQFAVMTWTADMLKPFHWEYIERLQPLMHVENVPGGALLYHGSPNSVRGFIRNSEAAEEALKSHPEKWLAGGHSHNEKLFRIGHQSVVGAGSVGISLDGVGGVAKYALIDEHETRPGRGVVFRSVAYDLDGAVDAFRKSELAQCAPGITRAVISELLTGRYYMAGLAEFAAEYAEKQLGFKPSVIPFDLWNEAESAWDGSEWIKARMS